VVLNSEKLVSKSCDLGLSQEFNPPLVQLSKIIFWFFSLAHLLTSTVKSQISVMIRTGKSNSSEDPTCFKSEVT
jgi:hypothetical protein